MKKEITKIPAHIVQLKEIREIHGLSQQELSDHFHIPKRTIENWEEGKRRPPIYVKLMIAKILMLEKKLKKLEEQVK